MHDRLGARIGDTVLVFPPYTLNGCQAVGSVRAADTVVIRLDNMTGNNFNGVSATWRVKVMNMFSA